MQFQTPQFIDRETRVIGPLTLKQFAYVGVAGGFIFAFYFLIPNFAIFIPLALVAGFAGLSFAFIRVGTKSLPVYIAGVLKFAFAKKEYIWRKESMARKIAPEIAVSPQNAGLAQGEPKKEIRLQKKSKVQDLSTQVLTRTPSQ